MRSVTLTFPQLALIVMTRAMAAAGVALLLGDRLDRRQRRAVGATLAAVGAITTIPLAADVLAGTRAPHPTPVDHVPTGALGQRPPLVTSR
jgi:hypothetical protein